MNNQIDEDEYNKLKESELKEIIEYYDINEAWENNPIRILIESQLDEIHKEIDELINWRK